MSLATNVPMHMWARGLNAGPNQNELTSDDIEKSSDAERPWQLSSRTARSSTSLLKGKTGPPEGCVLGPDGGDIGHLWDGAQYAKPQPTAAVWRIERRPRYGRCRHHQA